MEKIIPIWVMVPFASHLIYLNSLIKKNFKIVFIMLENSKVLKLPILFLMEQF